MKKNILYLSMIFFNISLPIYFLNRYFIPELTNSILNYKDYSTNITIQPFVITANKANKSNNNQNLNFYEIEGNLSIKNLDLAYQIATQKRNTLPSEWILYDYNIPLRLEGGINSTGIGWNINYEIAPNCIIGWSSAFCQVTGAINIQPQEESQKYKLKEGMLFQITDKYNALTKSMGLIKNYTQYTNFADQDIYIKFHVGKDFAWQIRKLKLSLQLGGIIPTAHKSDIFNVADVPGGTNGFWAMYGGANLDFLLKEDVNFGLLGKLIFEFPNTKIIRTSSWLESERFGSYVGSVDIAPGFLYNFSPYLSLEGLRKGLGIKVAYSLWGKKQDQFGFDTNANIIEQAKISMERLSGWAQEHCDITFFYDFMREYTNYSFQPFLAFSAQIPVDFFFSYNSAQALGLSFIFEVLY